jgi:hypothetical protein
LREGGAERNTKNGDKVNSKPDHVDQHAGKQENQVDQGILQSIQAQLAPICPVRQDQLLTFYRPAHHFQQVAADKNRR